MENIEILENKKFNKGLFRVVLKLNELKIVGYVDDDGYYEDLSEIDENGSDIQFNSYEEKNQFHLKYVGIFDEMEFNCEIGFGGPIIE